MQSTDYVGFIDLILEKTKMQSTELVGFIDLILEKMNLRSIDTGIIDINTLFCYS